MFRNQKQYQKLEIIGIELFLFEFRIFCFTSKLSLLFRLLLYYFCI